MPSNTVSSFAPRALSTVALASGLLLGACGGSGGGSTSGDASPVLTGQVYPVVAGLSYRTESQKGVVASDGSFSYKAGELVTLSLAGVDLITAPGASKMSALDLDDDAAATLSLRLLRTLDTDANLANGAQITPVPSTNMSSVDLGNATAVATLAAQVKPGVTLAAADTQVTSALSSAKTTSAANAGSFGANYQGFFRKGLTTCPYPYATNASLQFSAQPNWTTKVLAGTMVVTLSDATTQVVALTQDTGVLATPGGTFNYTLERLQNSGTRALKLRLLPTPLDSRCISEIAMRDPSQANLPPIASVSMTELAIGLTPTASDTYTFHSDDSGPIGIFVGAKDYDGKIASIQWKSSKNKSASGPLFTETVAPGEDVTFTLTVTDDQGAVGVNTWNISRKSLTIDQALDMIGTRTWKYDTPDGGFNYYYRLSANKQTFTEYEVPVGGSTCAVSAQFSASGVTAGIDTSKIVFTSNSHFSYTDQFGERSSFTQVASIPGGC